MSRRAALAVGMGGIGVVFTVGWLWFLATNSLADADSWSSVLSGVLALISLALTVWGLRNGGGDVITRQRRAVRARDVDGTIDQGDRAHPGPVPQQEERTVKVRDIKGNINQGNDFRSS